LSEGEAENGEGCVWGWRFEIRACETMSGGGRAFGEMMMLGATVGSCGLRDQMAQMGWVDSCAVDTESTWEYDEDVGVASVEAEGFRIPLGGDGYRHGQLFW